MAAAKRLLSQAASLMACAADLLEGRPGDRPALGRALRFLAAQARARAGVAADPEQPRREEAIRREVRTPGSARSRLVACWGEHSPLLPRLLALAARENPVVAAAAVTIDTSDETQWKDL